MGQNTGTDWATANFVFVPVNTSMKSGRPDISFTSYPANIMNNGLKSGQFIQMWLPINGVTPPVPVGTDTVGTIWVQYTTASNSNPTYAKMAYIALKAS